MLALHALVLLLPAAHADVVISEGTNLHVDIAADGRIAMDLLGSLWVQQAGHVDAAPVDTGAHAVRRPRFSPDGNSLVFESGAADRTGLYILEPGNGTGTSIGDDRYANRFPEWHPGGQRIVFSSARNDRGFDLWEVDVATGLEWRLSDRPGDETEPAWSSDGRHLVYVHVHDGRWSLMLRRFGLPDELLVASTQPIAAPSWRPDGSLVTWLAREDTGWTVWMTILSAPRLHRRLLADDDVFLSPVAWPDRQRMIYAANGHIRTRPFDAWTSVTIPFRARIGEPPDVAAARASQRTLPAVDRPSGRTIIRAGRLFDGLGNGYIDNVDVVIDDGVVSAVEARRDRSDGIVVDLGDLTLLPGLVDAYAALPDSADASLGPLLLGLGVTTVVAEHVRADELDRTWSGKDMPGPRLLAASALATAMPDGPLPWLVTLRGDRNPAAEKRTKVLEWQQRGVAVLADSWQAAVGAGASLLLGVDSGPTSPAGRRYADVRLSSGSGEITLVSGLADAGTPGVDDLWRSRVANQLPRPRQLARRFTRLPDLAASAPTLVAGSFPNGLPPGIALQAELRALVAAGLSPAEALKAAGVNAARALGLGLGIGRVAPGALADLLVVDGDPLANVEDALLIVGIVRNGRFFSVSGLLDRAVSGTNVE